MRIKLHFPHIEWKPENVVKFIVACREDEGIPVFQTRFAGIPFEEDDRRLVLAKCNFGHDKVGTVVFDNVPEDIFEKIDREKRDWHWLLTEYGTPEEIEHAYRYGVYIRSAKLPVFLKLEI